MAVAAALERAVAVSVVVAKVVAGAVVVEWCLSGGHVAVAVMWQWRPSGGGS